MSESTAAARQRRYRESKRAAHHVRLQAMISADADAALEALAVRYSVTKQAALERIILEAQALQRDATPALDLAPSAPPPRPKDYPAWLKARAVALHASGESRETIRAMLIEQFGKAPDESNWAKTMRRWAESQGSERAI